MTRKNMVLNLDQVIELKKALADQFGATLHFHDACGAQSFSMDPDKLTPEVRDYLNSYSGECKAVAHIADDGNIVVTRQ